MPTIFGVISDKSGTDVVTNVLESDVDGMNLWENMKSTETTYTSGSRQEIILNIDRWHTGSTNMKLRVLNFTRAAIISGDFKFLLNEFENDWYEPVTAQAWMDDPMAISEKTTGRSLGTDCSIDYNKPMSSYLFNITADPTESNNLVDQFPHHVSHFTKLLAEYDIDTTAYQRTMSTRAFGAFSKAGNYFVPWCEHDCPTTSDDPPTSA
eukprot:FR741424.1.p1 GENE.FR741424.1~~FR741424.1.p1  ORF type:complete len:235 (+),score=22.31 FR741424.1:80-706(+)